MNEKLLGDFIRKHGVRDQVFGKPNVRIYGTGMTSQAHHGQSLPNADLMFLGGLAPSPIPQNTFKNTSKAQLKDWGSRLIFTIFIE